MAYTSGAITDPSTFMDVLKTFLVANGWTLLDDVTEASVITSTYSTRTMYYKSSEDVYIAFQSYTYESTSTTMYERVTTIVNAVMQSYESGVTLANQYNSRYFRFRLHDTRTRYYIIANDRRVIISTDMYGRSTLTYVGYLLPSVSAELLPKPMFVTGTNTLGLTVTTKTFGSFAINTDSGTSTTLAYAKLSIATTYYASITPLQLTPKYMYATERYARTTNDKQMMIPINVVHNYTDDYGGILGMVEGIYTAYAWNGVKSFDLYTDSDDVEYLAISGASDINDPILAVKLS
ncbi:MAG: hypothetical protein R3Y11_00450 [Pseudomonadota bacterium]